MMQLVAVIGLSALALMQPTLLRAETLRWTCNYTTMASPTGLGVEKFLLEFALDTITKKAITVGRAGMADVTGVGGDQGISFQETLDSGAVRNHDDSERRFVSSQPPYDVQWKTDTIAVLRDVQMKRAWCVVRS